MRALAGAFLIVALSAAQAAAQATADRFLVSLNGGVQATPNDFSQSGTFEEFLEEGTFDADYELKSAPQFDGAILMRLWKKVHVGAAVSYMDDRTSTNISARVPHPFFFNRHRNVGGSTNLTRKETATHVLLAWPFPVGRSFMVLFSAGPSFFHVEQDVVDDIAYDHAFPFNEATFRNAIAARVKANGVGFNVGADLSWNFARHFGAGLLVRFSQASVDLRASQRNSVSSDTGGLHAGIGLRMRF